MNPVGMIGRCPTVDIVMNGRKVRGLIDTGSEVTTVTERWVAENLQNSDLLPSDLEGSKRAGDSV